MIAAKWMNACLVFTGLLCLGLSSTHAQSRHDLLDRLPPEDAIYVWTHDTQVLFGHLAQVMRLDRQRLESVLR